MFEAHFKYIYYLPKEALENEHLVSGEEKRGVSTWHILGLETRVTHRGVVGDNGQEGGAQICILEKKLLCRLFVSHGIIDVTDRVTSC